MSAYPTYLELRQPLPLRVWHVLRALAVASAAALIVTLFVAPRQGLIAWWLFVLPSLPLVLLLAPGIWRNLCPMATLNQVPRLFGFSLARTAPRWLLDHALLIQATFYFALISTRAPWLDHNGPAVGTMMILALASAFVGGVAFKGKSGWCGTLCPLMPVQRLYGQTPAVVVPNSHCKTCVGCTTNCLDFNPHLAVVADVHDAPPKRLSQFELFAGMFPGFVLAFFTVPNSVIGAPADIGMTLGRFYGLTLVYMLVSLGVFYVLKSLAPLPELVLLALFGAAAFNIHNVLRFNTAYHFAKPLWLEIGEIAVVAAASVTFVARTWLKELRVRELALDAPAADAAAVRGTSHLGGSSATHAEVRFADGPRIVVARGTTVLEAAERAELPVEAGCRMGVCGADPIAVIGDTAVLSPPSAGERSTLERLGLGHDCRMACSARVLGDVDVTFELRPAEPEAPAAASGEYDRSVERVVVIGNGIAGSTAADHVRRRHPDCTIDVIGEELHLAYNRMGITRLVYGRSAMSGLLLLGEEWYERNRITPWLNTVVDEIDRDAREVVLATGERLPYDRLILASGASAFVPPLGGIDRPNVFVMRHADDAVGIRAHAQRTHARRATVVGGGLLGLEAAFALHQFGLRTTVVQRSERLLAGQLDERGAALLERYFLGLGINVLLGSEPTAVAEDGSLQLADGTAVASDVVVVCAGIRPNVDLAAAAGLELGRGVVVDERMQTSDPAIYAAGDVAEANGAVYGLWPVAVAQAEVAAANAVGGDAVYTPQPPITILKGVGLSVKSIGDVEGGAGDDVEVDDPGEDDVRYRRVVTRDGVPVGAVFVGDWPDSADVLDAVAAGVALARA